jgi:hypothetical protein
MLSFRQLTLALCLALSLHAQFLSAADGPAPLTLKDSKIGFAGKFKAGFWQPVWLTVVAGPSGARGQLELVVADGDQTPAVFRDSDRGTIDLAAGTEKTILLYCQSGPATAPITVRLTNDGKTLWTQTLAASTPPLRSTQDFIVTLGPSIGIDEAAKTIRRPADTALATARVTSAAELPDRWWGYEGVDRIALATSDTAFLNSLTTDQQQAITQWVLLGGRLILCVGREGETIAKSSSPWLPLIPGDFVETDPLRERSGLEIFTKSELPFDDPNFQRNRPYITRLKNIRGEALLDEVTSATGRPLAIHSTAGLGQVTFVALDLDHPTLENWKGRTRLVSSLLQITPADRDQSEHNTHVGIKQLGYDDLIGQFRTALGQFPGVSLVNFTTVSVLTLLYLLIIGPGDYLLLSKLNLPRQITWLTFPAVALVMIGLTSVLGHQFHGRSVRLNQAEIIDIDLKQQVVRGTAWFNLYSPATTRFDISFGTLRPNLGSKPFEGGWLTSQGLPGDALGGLESHQPALARRREYLVWSPTERIFPQLRSLTLDAASSKSLSARWWTKTELPTETKLTVDRFGLLAGEFQQPLNIPLTECLLAHGEKLYRLGTLTPGQRVIMAEQSPLNLEARLTQRRVEQTKDVSTPWEQDSVDVPRIMQMLMFHESARGRNYTGLTHRYQPEIDLSEHIRLGHPVLIGRAERPVANLGDSSGDGEPIIAADQRTHWTYFRIILPVNQKPVTSDQ